MRTHQSRIQNSWKVCGVPGMRGLLARPRAGQAARRGPPPQPAGAAAGVPSAPAGGRRARARYLGAPGKGRPGSALPTQVARWPPCISTAATRPLLPHLRARGLPSVPAQDARAAAARRRRPAALPPCSRAPANITGEGGAGWTGEGKVQDHSPASAGRGPRPVRRALLLGGRRRVQRVQQQRRRAARLAAVRLAVLAEGEHHRVDRHRVHLAPRARRHYNLRPTLYLLQHHVRDHHVHLARAAAHGPLSRAGSTRAPARRPGTGCMRRAGRGMLTRLAC